MAGILKMASGSLKSLFNWLVPNIKQTNRVNCSRKLTWKVHQLSYYVAFCVVLLCVVLSCLPEYWITSYKSTTNSSAWSPAHKELGNKGQILVHNRKPTWAISPPPCAAWEVHSSLWISFPKQITCRWAWRNRATLPWVGSPAKPLLSFINYSGRRRGPSWLRRLSLLRQLGWSGRSSFSCARCTEKSLPPNSGGGRLAGLFLGPIGVQDGRARGAATEPSPSGLGWPRLRSLFFWGGLFPRDEGPPPVLEGRANSSKWHFSQSKSQLLLRLHNVR